ncbi:hypothetical protein SDC9_63961 [bioreactor metagenome]|uniref:Uncharacterized protein n=1 Tax=bioreactor metagenome TaxID=1076179 RepID=A0A644XN46_9ZZZZ
MRFPPMESISPPKNMVGFISVSMRIEESIPVVVVLPCVPDTQMAFLYFFMIRPRNSALSIMSRFSSCALTSSGLSFEIADVYTTRSMSVPMFFPSWPMFILAPSFSSFFTMWDEFLSEPDTLTPSSIIISANALMLMPPIPIKYI